MNKKPVYFLVLKIVGFIAIFIGLCGFMLSVSSFGKFDNNNFMLGAFLGSIGFFVGFVCLMLGFRPELSKLSIKTSKYIQEENKEDLKDMANTTADITGDAISKVARSIKEGLEEETMFCKHCGAVIDADSTFCSKCGKMQ